MVVPSFKVKREKQIGVLVLGMGSEHSSERDTPKDLKTGQTMLNNHYVNQQHKDINLEEKYIEHMTTQKNDRHALASLTFTTILRGHPPYPEDLQDLLQLDVLNADDRKVIVNHPSLWHWTSRSSFYERFWNHCYHGGTFVQGQKGRADRSFNLGNGIRTFL
ncbi:hypothetical protein FCV25MIE_22515 [Fagus crenata]